jgi:pyruvate dehydrogenase E2 component (dihydrolipoyllysine-residue acetyltransferase)
MSEFKLPSLGADMESAIVARWIVHPGDRIKRGDILAEVETDKGLVSIEVFEDGIVDRILVPVDAKVPVGTVLATIRSNGAAAAAPAAPPEAVKPAPPEPPAQREARPPAPAEAPAPAAGERVRASPSSRQLARELGIDLHGVQGTGPGGAIQRSDVERAAEAGKAAPVPPAVAAPSPAAAAPAAAATAPGRAASADFQAGMRRAIAAAMARSNREIPHYYLETHVDMSRALRWLEAENQKRSIRDRLLPVVLLLKGVARALAEVPELNGYWLDDRLQVQESVHIGFAISLRQGGLVTPALHHVDLKSLDELMAAMSDLITRTRAGQLRSSELTDATITVTNLGDLGVETVHGVIYPPQVALVGFGKVLERPWAEGGMLGIRPILAATLAGDHRATDGRKGAQFLDALNRTLQEPAHL